MLLHFSSTPKVACAFNPLQNLRLGVIIPCLRLKKNEKPNISKHVKPATIKIFADHCPSHSSHQDRWFYTSPRDQSQHQMSWLFPVSARLWCWVTEVRCPELRCPEASVDSPLQCGPQLYIGLLNYGVYDKLYRLLELWSPNVTNSAMDISVTYGQSRNIKKRSLCVGAGTKLLG